MQGKSTFKLLVGVVLMAWAVLAVVAHVYFPFETLLIFGVGALLV